MPVQIDEIVITTTVNPQASGSSDNSVSTQRQDPQETQRDLADKILEITREKTER